MTKEQEMVRDFHRVFGCTVNETPTIPSAEDRMMRARLHEEEFLEHFNAGCPVERFDAYLDLAYVIYGTAVTYGIEPSPIPWRNSEEPLDIAVSALNRSVIDAKSPSWVAGLCEMSLTSILRRCMAVGWDFEAGFSEVHRSNMTKLWTLSEVSHLDLSTHTMKAVTPGSYAVLNGDIHARAYVVKRNDGKVIKSPSYSPANLSAILSIG